MELRERSKSQDEAAIAIGIAIGIGIGGTTLSLFAQHINAGLRSGG